MSRKKHFTDYLEVSMYIDYLKKANKRLKKKVKQLRKQLER